MKRIATAAVAATTALTIVATPAFAQETETQTGSSAVFQDCKTDADKEYEAVKNAEGKEAKDEAKATFEKNNGSSTPTGACIKQLIDNEDTKAGTLALLIGVPVALVAILGVAAAYAGVIPGVELPALPF